MYNYELFPHFITLSGSLFPVNSAHVKPDLFIFCNFPACSQPLQSPGYYAIGIPALSIKSCFLSLWESPQAHSRLSAITMVRAIRHGLKKDSFSAFYGPRLFPWQVSYCSNWNRVGSSDCLVRKVSYTMNLPSSASVFFWWPASWMDSKPYPVFLCSR